jgi:hypothetical protein
MKSAQWKTYRTRFLVKAKQLNSNLSFVDSLGRHHSGRKGDYLVESADGILRIHPRQIFEDIYVPMALVDEAQIARLDEPARGRRKLPQSCRDRRPSGTRLGLM